MFTDLLVPRGPRALRTAKKANESLVRGSIFAVELVAVCLVTALVSSARAESIYYGSSNIGVVRSNLDGSNFSFVGRNYGSSTLTADPLAGKIYGVYWGGPIYRMNLDGSAEEDLAPWANGIAINGASKTLYFTKGNEIWSWATNRPFATFTARPLIQPGGERIEKLALDVSGGKIYWTYNGQLPGTAGISRANLDGTGVEPLVTGVSEASAIALDVAGGKMYWSDRRPNDIEGYEIVRSNLDGTDQETILSNLISAFNSPPGIALDRSGGKIYWVGNYVMWANLDGTSAEIFPASLSLPGAQPTSVVIIPEPSSFALAALGLVGLVAWRRRKR
jgi:MYXO-CTERM domain-containing protein